MAFFDQPQKPEMTVTEALEFTKTGYSRKLEDYARERRGHGLRTTMAVVAIWCVIGLAVIGLATVVNGLR